MKQPPKDIFSLNAFWGHILGIPLFTLGLLLLFCPFAFKEYSIAFGRYSFHIVMIFCIILGVLLAVRLPMLFISRKIMPTQRQYWFMCFFEVLFSAGFAALYLWLFTKKADAYFLFFGYAIVYLAMAMITPYLILYQHFTILEKEEELSNTDRLIQGEKIRFIDERGNVKLIVAQTSVLYIQSDENYLRIYYMDEGKISTYLLRSSMKRVEDMCAKNGLIRCHRSYFVNKNRVEVLQKEKDFTYAVLDVPNAARIPVSKNYYDQISAML
jgi:hypothetical protein